MLHLYHIPGVRIEACKDHRAIQRRQHAFFRGCNQVDTIMPDISIIMRRNHSIYRLVEKDTVSRNRIRVQDKLYFSASSKSFTNFFSSFV